MTTINAFLIEEVKGGKVSPLMRTAFTRCLNACKLGVWRPPPTTMPGPCSEKSASPQEGMGH
jgi:hypothetical protein